MDIFFRACIAICRISLESILLLTYLSTDFLMAWTIQINPASQLCFSFKKCNLFQGTFLIMFQGTMCNVVYKFVVIKQFHWSTLSDSQVKSRIIFNHNCSHVPRAIARNSSSALDRILLLALQDTGFPPRKITTN